jgi:pyruvate dehydrogenase E2 component (dihydrolipoamide acetyltransferase)
MHIILMPKSGQTMEEGAVLRWLKKEGEPVQAGETVVEIETDKAIAEVASEASGVLRKILVSEGETVPVLAPLAYVGGPKEEVPSGATKLDSKRVEVEPALPAATTEGTQALPRISRLVSPRARKLAAAHGVDLDLVAGSGPEGRITEDDVKNFLAYEQQVASDRRRLSRRQYSIGKQLQKSKQTVPHFYVTTDVNMEKILEIKGAIKAATSATITDFVVKSAGLALKDWPEVNCRWEGEELVYNQFINVGVAVDVDDGLLVVTIPDVDKKTLGEVAGQSKVLIEKAREGKVFPQPSSLTVSNLGMHGVRQFVGIINPPEIAILAVGAITSIVQIDESTGDMRAVRMMTLALSCDHRALNGVQGARFLNSVKSYLQDPGAWIKEGEP